MSSPFRGSFGSPADYDAAITELRTLLADDAVSADPEVLAAHGFSKWSYHTASPPSAVVYAGSTEDVVKTVNVSKKWRVPIIAYSAGTSLEGHFTASFGGICVDLSRMDMILQINVADSDLVCQAGTRWDDINLQLKEKGIPLFFPLDPARGASIGGMIATGCSGTNAVRYGSARAEWFLNLTVVLPSGEVIKTRRRARKCSAGFDTAKVFIGAEGTLGIVTEATIRLAPLLPTTVAYVHFPDVSSATIATTEALNKGIPIQCAELGDDEFIAVINRSGLLPFKLPEATTVFFKFQGSPLIMQEASDIAQAAAEKHGGHGYKLMKTEEEAELVWTARKVMLLSILKEIPDGKLYATDVCVPVSKLPQLLIDTKEDMKRNGIEGVTGGHIGDGNFHAGLVFRNEAELEVVRGIVHRMVDRALELDGTCTGEHGVGIGKKEYLIAELGENTVNLMKTIKRTLDPLGLFNPGKLYPDESDSHEVVVPLSHV